MGLMSNITDDIIEPMAKKLGTAKIPAKTTPQAEAGKQIVYHGSPYSISEFSSKHIGSGERAQSYGYGLYFTDSKKIAEHYSNKLAESSERLSMPMDDAARLIADRINQKTKEKGGTHIVSELDIINKMNRIVDRAIEYDDNVKLWLDKSPEDRFAAAAAVAYENSPKILEGILDKKGRIYEVELIPDKYEFLLWDKPLSGQSNKVQDAIKKAAVQDTKLNLAEEETAAATYFRIAEYLGSEKAASDYLHALGIRGIKYLDGISRGKGEGGYNYVIFSDKDVKLLPNPSRPPEVGGQSKNFSSILKSISPYAGIMGAGIASQAYATPTPEQEALQEPTFDPTTLLAGPARWGGGLMNMGIDTAMRYLTR